MAISKTHLEIWSHQGAVAQSRDTYATIRRALESDQARYDSRRFKIFLQGSYGNDTNVYAESDVDVVICLQSTFHYNVDNLTQAERAAFEESYPVSTSYKYPQFKAHVQQALETAFPGAVTVRSKAFKIVARGNRRSADVVAATQFRHYRRFATKRDCQYDEGIRFVTSAGDPIVNYPLQHSGNCTIKHQQTNRWYKPTIRIYKNMRNKLVGRQMISRGLAPSYFLEGLLYNVRRESFGGDYHDTLVRTFDWINRLDRSQFTCVNDLRPLLGDTSDTWSPTDCEAFLDAFARFWDEGL